MASKTIIFVGDKPSAKNIDPNIPFVGTKSYKVLLQWVYEMDINISDVQLENSNNERFKVYLELCKKLGNGNLHDGGLKLIALGNSAEKILKEFDHPHFKLPHPSPKNRKLNDKDLIKKELKKCKDWLNENY